MASLPVAERFFRHVDRSPHPRGCWIWTGATNEDGYGIFGWAPGVTMRAHRASWRIANGRDPGEMKLRHSCDTPACVNPEHVHPGTQRLNMIDRRIKGRWKGGRPKALTEEQRAQVARRLMMGETTTAIARSFGVSRATVRNVQTRAGATRHV